jgi:sterol desaturase/sphingolipid hydroxylase (fatty acid hydroxylase superfamily)
VRQATETVYELGGAADTASGPVFRDEMARLFKSAFFEFFSRVHPVVPAGIFVPVVAWFGWQGVLDTGPLLAAALVLGGALVWTPVEYLMHRFIFHMKRTGPLSNWMYLTFHGVHHMYPDDALRLVMVPAVSIPLAFVFYGVFALTLPSGWASPAFAGFVLGYLAYDYSHFATHFVRPPKTGWLAPLARVMMEQKKRHMRHHFGDHEKGYGVSTGLWDHVFGTVDPREK